jgi:hypothetical protein
MAITNKDFPAFVSLMERAKAAIPEVYGEIERIHADWQANGCLDIQVTLIQEAPTESLREFHPGHYTIHFVWDPYQGGSWGPGDWDVRDYGEKKWKLPFDKSDAYLIQCETPRVWFVNDQTEEGSAKRHVFILDSVARKLQISPEEREMMTSLTIISESNHG